MDSSALQAILAGAEHPAVRVERAIEQHALDPDVVVEVLR